MKALFVFLVFLLPSHGQEIRVEVTSKLVQDVIKNENIPSVISAVTCWSMSDNFYFVKTSKVPVQLNGRMNTVRRVIDDSTNKVWNFVDMRCAGSYEMFQKLEPSLFAHPSRWILLEPDENRLTNLSFLIDSNILCINFNPELSHFHLKQVYKIDAEQSGFIHEIFGHWNEESGLVDLRVTRILSRRRRDLQGKVLKSVVILTKNESLGEVDSLKNAHIDSLGKMGYVITNILADSVNTTVSYKYVNTWGYGDMKHPEKLKGMMGPLVRNEIHVTGTVLFMTTDRLPHLEYLSVTLPTRGAFLFRAPPLSYVSNIYYLPFNGIVWICSILLVIVCTIAIYFTYRLTQMKDENMTASDYWLFAISTVCQMGSHLSPKKSSGRIATFVFCLSLIFLYTSYTANIVALLQSTSPNIRTLTDLLNSNLEMSVDDTPFNRYYFPMETEPVRKKIYEKIKTKPVQFVNITYGISMVRKGLYAFHNELGIGYKYLKETFYEHEKCGLKKIEYYQALDPWHAAPKHSPFKEIFKVNLFKIHEHGIQTIEKARRYTDPPVCSSSGQSFESVRITECYAPFLVLCYGIAATLILYIFERINDKFNCVSNLK